MPTSYDEYIKYYEELFRKDETVRVRALEAKEGFKFGCDPELFVFDDKDRPVTAEGLIPGTKEEPYKVEFGAVQVDGMAAEFNTDPATNFKDFNRNITAVMGQLEAMLPKGYSLKAIPSVVFDPEVFDAAPDKAKELGCMPDFDAWSGELNPPPHDPENPYLRTASGHIHIGWTEDAEMSDLQHIINCQDLVKQLDWYLGGWSLSQDADPVRRRLYGKAGACRYKPYGVEYRVLSNFWITDSDKRLEVWNRLQAAIDAMRMSYIPDRAGDFNLLLRESINSSVMHPAVKTSFRHPIEILTATTKKSKPYFLEMED